MLYVSFLASLHFKLWKDFYLFIYIQRVNLKAVCTQGTLAFIKTIAMKHKPKVVWATKHCYQALLPHSELQ